MPSRAQTRQPTEGLTGAHTTLEGLIANKEAAASIVLKPSRNASRELAGGHQSRLRGRGMEFEEVRGYQPGDDVRNIDWRVTARTTVTHTKTFTEERERPVLILCDQRIPMFFGSQKRFKSVQAANIASLLAWSALKRKDRVGGLLLGGEEIREFRAQRSDKAVLRMLAGLNELNQNLQREQLLSRRRHSLSEALEDLRRIAKTGSSLFIISDFSDLKDEGLRHLYELSRHNSVLAFAIYDPLERELPPRGRHRVCNGRRDVVVDTGTSRHQQQYRQQARQQAEQLHSSLCKLNIPLVQIATTDNPLSVLSGVFQRTRRRANLA